MLYIVHNTDIFLKLYDNCIKRIRNFIYLVSFIKDAKEFRCNC